MTLKDILDNMVFAPIVQLNDDIAIVEHPDLVKFTCKVDINKHHYILLAKGFDNWIGKEMYEAAINHNNLIMDMSELNIGERASIIYPLKWYGNIKKPYVVDDDIQYIGCVQMNYTKHVIVIPNNIFALISVCYNEDDKFATLYICPVSYKSVEIYTNVELGELCP